MSKRVKFFVCLFVCLFIYNSLAPLTVQEASKGLIGSRITILLKLDGLKINGEQVY